MNRKYLDDSTLDESIEAMRAGRIFDDSTGCQHADTEYLGRLLQLPTAKPLTSDSTEFDLRSVDRLDGVL
jgi:hypothetical protein